MFMYKFKNKLLPNVCGCLLTLNVDYSLNTYCLRNVNDFASPLHRTSIREKCIKVCGPKYWNTVPIDIKTIATEHSFKFNLRHSLIIKYSNID